MLDLLMSTPLCHGVPSLVCWKDGTPYCHPPYGHSKVQAKKDTCDRVVLFLQTSLVLVITLNFDLKQGL